VTPVAPVPGLEPAFTVDARLGSLEDHGVTRAGHRRVVPVAGGRVSGLPGAEARLDAEIIPGGADWQVVRPDGTVENDTRYSARAADAEYVHLAHHGGAQRAARRARGTAARGIRRSFAYYFRVAVYLETSAPRLAFLERPAFVASAIRGADSVPCTAYR
jgi:hypothetical protein